MASKLLTPKGDQLGILISFIRRGDRFTGYLDLEGRDSLKGVEASEELPFAVLIESQFGERSKARVTSIVGGRSSQKVEGSVEHAVSAQLEQAVAEAAASIYGCERDDIGVSRAPEDPTTVVVNWSESMKAGGTVRAAVKQAVLAALPEQYRAYRVMVV